MLAAVATVSIAATPAQARDRWGGGNWGRHYQHDRVDAGDIFAGVLIIGAIAAIASASTKAKKDQRRAEPDYRYPADDYQRGNSGNYNSDDRPEWREGTGIDSAVNRCRDEVSRGSTRIDTVDSVAREGDGWRVQGRATGGGSFSCTVDGDGRIRNVNIDGRAL
ncbi:hypothetical protein [Novosphingobium sp.]|uniref:hypothetical protein n=1 Tax=Novosphingobium sp. TaxID=1874826 RepID=UPI0027366478|nr:hypothetical protein [Novosphingobium sp.]